MLKRTGAHWCPPANILRLRTTPSQTLLAQGAAAQLRMLNDFLERTSEAKQWQFALGAMSDALRRNVPVDASSLAMLLGTLGVARKGDVVVQVVNAVAQHKLISKSEQEKVLRPAMFQALATAGNYDIAQEKIAQLVRQQSSGEPSAAKPLTADELEQAMQAALVALRRDKNALDTAGRPLWESAIAMFVQCRVNPNTRAATELTPQLVHVACQLLERGQRWAAAITVLSTAQQRAVAIKDGTLDVVVRCAFKAQKHLHVVRVVERCVASKVSPHEATARLALVSCDEASPYSPSAWAVSCQLLQALVDNGLPILPVTYETVARSCATCPAGRWDLAIEVAGRMVRDGLAPQLHTLKLIMATRIAHSTSFAEAERLSALPMFDTSVGKKADLLVLLAQLKCSINLGDWHAYGRVNRKFIMMEAPITHEKLLLQVEGSYLQRDWLRALTQFNKAVERILRLLSKDHKRSKQGSSSDEGMEQKMFPVYHCDIFIPERVWKMVDESIQEAEKIAPNSDVISLAKQFVTKLTPLRGMEEMLFAPGEVDGWIDSSRLLPSRGSLGSTAPPWAHNAQKRRDFSVTS